MNVPQRAIYAMKKTSIITTSIVGVILLIVGVYMSVVLKNPHFYTPFSVSLALITLNIFNKISPEPLFYKWSFLQHIIFWVLLIIASMVIVRTGTSLGYWYYPYYHTALDERIKIIFEFTVPLLYFMNIFLIGKALWYKWGVTSALFSGILSVVIFAPLSLIITEYINSFSHSWVFTVSQTAWYTIGAWLLVFIPLCLYKWVQFRQ